MPSAIPHFIYKNERKKIRKIMGKSRAVEHNQK